MERDSSDLQPVSSEKLSSSAEEDSSTTAKKVAPILANGPSSILHEHSQISTGQLTGNDGKMRSAEITGLHGNGSKAEDDGEDHQMEETSTRDSSSPGTGTVSTNHELAAYNDSKEKARDDLVEELHGESANDTTLITQTSFVNTLALSSTGISSEEDRRERDCGSNTEDLCKVSRDKDYRFDRQSGEEYRRCVEKGLDKRIDDDILEPSNSSIEVNESNSVKETDRDDLGANRDDLESNRDDLGVNMGNVMNADKEVLEAGRDGLGHIASGGEEEVLGEGDKVMDKEDRDRGRMSEDRNLEQFSEILLDSDLSGSEEEGPGEGGEIGASMAAEGGDESGEASSVPSKKTKRVRFADEVPGSNGLNHHAPPQGSQSSEASPTATTASPPSPKHKGSSVKQYSMRELINGVVMPAEYLGSTPILLGGTGTVKAARMYQAQQAVQLVKDPENESRPRFAVNVKISTSAIILADQSTGLDLMDHPLHTITYVADIDRVLVIMAHVLPTPVSSPAATRASPPASGGEDTPTGSPPPSSGREEPSANFNPKLTCHILDAPNARNIAMVIGQAFSAAYKQALQVSGVKEDQMEQAEYAHVLNAQSVPKLEVESLGDRNKTKKLTIAKHRNDMMGIMVTESGYGSAIPALVIAHLSKTGSAAKSGLLNVGDHILSINGVNLVGMPRKNCIEQIKKCRPMNVVKMEVCSCPAVVDVTIVRPDLKYQLGFTVHDGMICSLMRGSIAERSGVRVGHRIIEINGTSTVGLQHAEIVHLLSSTVGDLHIRTMSEVMYRLLTGKIQPEYY